MASVIAVTTREVVGTTIGLLLIVLALVAMLGLIWPVDRFELADRLGRLIGRLWPGEPPYDGDECEVCGHMGADNTTLTAVKDRSGGGVVGGSAISATFCPEHLPDERRPATAFGRGIAEGLRRYPEYDPSSEESEGTP